MSLTGPVRNHQEDGLYAIIDFLVDYNTSTVFKSVVSTLFVTEVTQYFDTAVTNIKTSKIPVNSTVTESADVAIDQLAPFNSYTGLATQTTRLNGSAVNSFGAAM